jgi:hypothetical protein
MEPNGTIEKIPISQFPFPENLSGWAVYAAAARI